MSTKTITLALYNFRGYQDMEAKEVFKHVEEAGVYTRVSEPQDVTFTLSTDAATKQVKNIRKQMQEEMAAAYAVQQTLQSQIDDLLALPNLTGETE